MTRDAQSYWQPICAIVHRFRCWTRLASKKGISPWGQLLTIPTNGYLEARWGPLPFRQVEWVQLMPVRVRGGLAGRPLELVDTRNDVAAAVQETQALWCYREERWSLEGVFNDHRGTAIHVANPFKTSS